MVVAPAFTQSVADALSGRFDDLGQHDVTVVLDSDLEVYRLGFGDCAALETKTKLRQKPGAFLVDKR